MGSTVGGKGGGSVGGGQLGCGLGVAVAVHGMRRFVAVAVGKTGWGVTV